VSDVASREGGNPDRGLIYFFSTIEGWANIIILIQTNWWELFLDPIWDYFVAAMHIDDMWSCSNKY
jgi:hypothetical protein